jgi:hypothetical protein
MTGKRTPNLARIKHKKFAKELVSNGFKKVEAYKMVYPEASEASANVLSSRLLQVQEVQREIARITDNFSKDWIERSIGEIAVNGKKEDSRLRALEMLGKARSLFKSEAPSQQINVLAQFDTPEARKDLMNSNNQPSISDIIDPELHKSNDSNDIGNTV